MTYEPDIMNEIRAKQMQRRVDNARGVPVPEHRPEILYIGCVDARLDPINEIGIPKGKALIYRNIGASVPKADGNGPENVSIGATLEFFIKGIPAKEGKVKHIVVAGHTHCGGIGHACSHHHELGATDNFLMRYLSTFTDAIKSVVGGGTEKPNAAAVEEESVRKSVANLRQYAAVKAAGDKVEIHGWVLDTANQTIKELDKSGQFVPMRGPDHSHMAGIPSNTLSVVAK